MRTLGLVFVAFVVFSTSPAFAQAPATADETRKLAFALYDQHKLTEALPLLEKLATEKPDDALVLERLGLCLAAQAATVRDPGEQRKLNLRAREALQRAKSLGDDSNLLNAVLAGIPPDGITPEFSERREVEALMKDGEAEFARGNLDRARQQYARAFELAPTLYEAALFAGDACYKQKKFDDAGEWFAKAVHVNENRETAYRYWGDALMAAGRMAEARMKFIESVVAEPYGRAGRMGLTQWADRNKLRFTVPQLPSLASVTTSGADTKISLEATTLGDGRSAMGQASIVYAISRAAWQREKFKAEFPNEPSYRHTLKEEAEALDTVATRLGPKAGGGEEESKTLPDPALAELVRIRDAGLLEAYILLFRADEGISRDYAAYRAANRGKLVRFLDEFVVPRLDAKR